MLHFSPVAGKFEGVRPSNPFIKIDCSSRELQSACEISRSSASVAWNGMTAPHCRSIPFHPVAVTSDYMGALLGPSSNFPANGKKKWRLE